MRIFFIGTVRFSENMLTKLIGMSVVDVVGVCTLNKSPSNADHVDLAPFCRKHNIPVKYVTDINSKESINWIKALSPDIIFCFGWSQLLKTQLLYLAPLGVIGYHPTSLPANRGRHPLIWALVLGLKETASTFFFMDDGADSGDILSQYPIKISDNDTAGTLYKRITEVALKQVDEFIPALVSGVYKRVEQNHSLSNTWRKRGKDDGKIDWRMSAESINNLVRALSKPYPGAHFLFKGEVVKVWKIKIVKNDKKNIEPGKVILLRKNGILVKTGSDSVCLMETDPILDIEPGSYL